MALESITCKSCGATDVQEVKADTYFCNHCEGVFKHVNPSKVTVTQEFCVCGNRSMSSATSAREVSVGHVTSQLLCITTSARATCQRC